MRPVHPISCDQISGDRFIELFARERPSRCRSPRARTPLAIQRETPCRSPGRSAHLDPVPVRRASVRPVDRRHGVPALQRRLQREARHASRRGRAQLARDNYDVNDAWLCDKGRYASWFPRRAGPHRDPADPRPRARAGVVRRGAAAGRRVDRGQRVAILTGGRLMDEDYFALSKLARTSSERRPRPSPRGRDLAAAAGASGRGPDGGDLQGRGRRERDPRGRARRRAGSPRPCNCVRKAAMGRCPDLGGTSAPRACTTWRPMRACAPGDEVACSPEAPTPSSTRRSPPSGRPAAIRSCSRGSVRCRARQRGGRRRRTVPVCDAPGNDRVARSIAGVHPTAAAGGRSMAEVDDVERVWGPLMNREPGRDTLGILRACAATAT